MTTTVLGIDYSNCARQTLTIIEFPIQKMSGNIALCEKGLL